MGNMSFCPVAADTRWHHDEKESKSGLIDDAERGLSDEWLGREGCDPASTGEVFAMKMNAILSDSEDDKLGRINDLRRSMMDAWAEIETVKGMAKC